MFVCVQNPPFPHKFNGAVIVSEAGSLQGHPGLSQAILWDKEIHTIRAFPPCQYPVQYTDVVGSL